MLGNAAVLVPQGSMGKKGMMSHAPTVTGGDGGEISQRLFPTRRDNDLKG